MEHFTDQEIQSALELVMPPDEASKIARSLEVQADDVPVIGHGLTGHTLMLLSFLSEDLKTRVERYVGSPDGTLDRTWLAERDALESALKAAGRLPR
jgi:hypothetical protein